MRRRSRVHRHASYGLSSATIRSPRPASIRIRRASRQLFSATRMRRGRMSIEPSSTLMFASATTTMRPASRRSVSAKLSRTASFDFRISRIQPVLFSSRRRLSAQELALRRHASSRVRALTSYLVIAAAAKYQERQLALRPDTCDSPCYLVPAAPAQEPLANGQRRVVKGTEEDQPG